jgi:hypothetical protein
MNTVVDLSSLWDILLQAIMLIGSGVALLVGRWLNEKTIAGKLFDSRKILQEAITSGIAYANSKINKPVTVDVKNEIVKMAADYVVAYVPGALKSLKASPEDVAARVEAEVAKLLGLAEDMNKTIPEAVPAK